MIERASADRTLLTTALTAALLLMVLANIGTAANERELTPLATSRDRAMTALHSHHVRMVFPEELPPTLVLTALERMVALERSERAPDGKRAFTLLRRHIPRLLWDLSLQQAAMTACTPAASKRTEDWLAKNSARATLRNNGLAHLISLQNPRADTIAGDLHARYSRTTGGVPIPVASPSPGNTPAASAESVRTAIVTLFHELKLRQRFEAAVKEARPFINEHLRYADDRHCHLRQQRVQAAISTFTTLFGRPPAGPLPTVLEILHTRGYLTNPDYGRCPTGGLLTYDPRRTTQTVNCPLHGWYADWRRGPSPYTVEQANILLERNAVVWAYVHAWNCRLRRSRLRSVLQSRMVTHGNGRQALPRIMSRVQAQVPAACRCPLDNRAYFLADGPINATRDSQWAIDCPNHDIIVDTEGTKASFPVVDETGAGAANPTVRREPVVNSIGMKLLWLTAGSFVIGSPPGEAERSIFENPQRTVIFKRGFWMSECEVTQEQYKAIVGTNPSNNRGDQLPVEQVSWLAANQFVEKLSRHERQRGTLPDDFTYAIPSEAQWEYACRSGTSTAFSTGRSLTTLQANFDGRRPYQGSLPGRFLGKTVPVGQFPANPFGLFDMHGNVAEWCRDRWVATYHGLSPTGAARLSGSETRRVIRGGSWRTAGRDCRSASRQGVNGSRSSDAFEDVGFRVVVVPTVGH